MAKKPKRGSDVVHYGKKSWWSGRVRTTCGLTFEPGNEKQESWFTSATCPDCKSGARRHKY